MATRSSTIPIGLLSQVCEVLKDFDEAWQAVGLGGKPPRIEDALRNIADADRPIFLRELLAVEVELRLGLRQQPTVEEYVARFRELAGNSDWQRELEQLFQKFRRPPASEVATLTESAAQQATPYTGYVDPNQGTRVVATDAHSVVSGTSAQPRSLEVNQQFGRYRFLQVLGEGGMGRVFLAHDQQLDRKVALKIPRFQSRTDGAPERFLREARSAALLRHPNICPIFDVGEIDGFCFLTMAFIEGVTLKAHAKPDSLLPQRQVATLLQKLVLAIHDAHEHGVVHRDLKPDNIMLDARGEPIIMDFGLARRKQPGDQTLTQEGTVLGTPAYMSPEQVEGDIKAIGPASDLYSLGVILFELLTGQRPFQGPISVLMAKILRDQPPSLAALRHDVEPKLEWICWKAMSKRPTDRYRDGLEMADALQQFLTGSASIRSPMIRAPAVVIAAPSEPIETYQLTPKPAPPAETTSPESTPPSAIPHPDKIIERIQKLLGDASLSKKLIKYWTSEPSLRSKQAHARLLEIGRSEIQQQLAAEDHTAALRTAAAMHLVCRSPETLADLASSSETVAQARWNPKKPETGLAVWEKMLAAFPDEVELRSRAADFADRQAVELAKAKQPTSALALLRIASQWNDSHTIRQHLVSLLKQLAVSSLRTGKREAARKLLKEALSLAPDDESLKKMWTQNSANND